MESTRQTGIAGENDADHGAIDRTLFTHSPSEAARRLARIVGLTVASEAVGMSEARALKHWIDGSRAIQSHDTLARLYLVLDLAVAMSEVFADDAVARWFQLYNKDLDGKTPIQFLNTGAIDDAGPRLLNLVAAYSTANDVVTRETGTQVTR